MQTKNYIFQVQNAIYNTFLQENIGVQIILNRGFTVAYPHILIAGTKKITKSTLQTECITEIHLNTKDVSLARAIEILAKIEDILTLQKIRENIKFYNLHLCEIISSEIITAEESNFCGRIFVKTILD